MSAMKRLVRERAMGKHANLPFHIYVNVKNEFLGPEMPSGTTAGIWHGIYSRTYQTIMCHVFLESGAHWSGVPIHALSTTYDFSIPREYLMPWAAMGDDLESWHAKYLEGLSCEIHAPFKAGGRHTGIIIDWTDGYSRYPEEHKPLNLIVLENGQLALLPNNYATYRDDHFTNEQSRVNMKYYKRSEKVYWEQ